MRGSYPDIKALNAIQISTAIDVGADFFITMQIKAIKVLVLKDYL